MFLSKKFLKLFVITSCLFSLAVSCTQAEDKKNSATPAPATSATNSTASNPMTMMGPMMNPAMYMNMMNPAMYMNMMGPMMNPMGMMGGGMSHPMNMMYPMMGPMSGTMNPHGGNPMSQMPGRQMMDPKQYEEWFNQWSEMMKNMAPQSAAAPIEK